MLKICVTLNEGAKFDDDAGALFPRNRLRHTHTHTHTLRSSTLKSAKNTPDVTITCIVIETKLVSIRMTQNKMWWSHKMWWSSARVWYIACVSGVCLVLCVYRS